MVTSTLVFQMGIFRLVGNYSKGSKKNGYFEEFHENGELKTQCFYKDDLLHGYVENIQRRRNINQYRKIQYWD